MKTSIAHRQIWTVLGLSFFEWLVWLVAVERLDFRMISHLHFLGVVRNLGIPPRLFAGNPVEEYRDCYIATLKRRPHNDPL